MGWQGMLMSVVFLVLLTGVASAESYEPLLVQVITRHGDRTPTGPIQADPAVWTCTENVIAPGSQVSA